MQTSRCAKIPRQQNVAMVISRQSHQSCFAIIRSWLVITSRFKSEMHWLLSDWVVWSIKYHSCIKTYSVNGSIQGWTVAIFTYRPTSYLDNTTDYDTHPTLLYTIHLRHTASTIPIHIHQIFSLCPPFSYVCIYLYFIFSMSLFLLLIRAFSLHLLYNISVYLTFHYLPSFHPLAHAIHSFSNIPAQTDSDMFNYYVENWKIWKISWYQCIF